MSDLPTVPLFVPAASDSRARRSCRERQSRTTRAELMRWDDVRCSAMPAVPAGASEHPPAPTRRYNTPSRAARPIPKL